MAASFVRNMLGRQNKRAIAMILGHAERTFWNKLTTDEQAELRKVVLDVCSTYHQACVDMVESSVETGMEINQEAIQAIGRLTTAVQARRDLARVAGE